MAKTDDERIGDTLDYIESQVTPEQYRSVERKARGLNQATLSGLLSLGQANPLYSQKRRAVRANLLCSQALIENDIWRAISCGDIAKQSLLAGSEKNLRDRLRSWWTRPGVTIAQVCQTARTVLPSMPNWANDPFDPGRSAGPGGPFNGVGFNCFNGVVYWAYCGGALDLRWLWNVWMPAGNNDPVGALRKPMMKLDDTAREWKENDLHNGQYRVPAGHTVQFVNPGTPFGHVVMSLGNGLCISQNNCGTFDSSVFAQGELLPEDRLAIPRMAHGKTHIASIRNMQKGHYNVGNGYTKLISAAPFWA